MQPIQIEYQCMLCKKLRILFVPPALELPIGEEGYIKLYDIHQCVEGKMPFVLYVDANHDVRAQTQIRGENMFSSAKTLNIPLPKKVEYQVQTIPFTIKNATPLLCAVEIVDQLRGMKYVTSSEKRGKLIEVTSNLGYIHIKAYVFVGLDDEQASEWFAKTADGIEEMAIFDINSLTLLFELLDEKLANPCSIKSMVTIDLLLNAKTAIPSTTVTNLELFNTGWKEEFVEITKDEALIGKQILKQCIDNNSKTLYSIYKTLENEVSVSTFFDQVTNLAIHDYLVIQKLEFITI
ncbi:MAG: hypothetical protein ACTSYD_12525 [Candidatus Heimdallarchaeaceae archaeon]